MSPTHAGIRDLHIRDFRGIDDLTLSFVGPGDYPSEHRGSPEHGGSPRHRRRRRGRNPPKHRGSTLEP